VPDQFLGQRLVAQEGGLGRRLLAAAARDVADPIFALRVVEQGIGLAGVARQQFGGGGRGVGKALRRFVQAARLLGDLGPQVLGARAPAACAA
jgi:hypothetical protein